MAIHVAEKPFPFRGYVAANKVTHRSPVNPKQAARQTRIAPGGKGTAVSNPHETAAETHLDDGRGTGWRNEEGVDGGVRHIPGRSLPLLVAAPSRTSVARFVGRRSFGGMGPFDYGDGNGAGSCAHDA